MIKKQHPTTILHHKPTTMSLPQKHSKIKTSNNSKDFIVDHNHEDTSSLLPGLPNHLAQLCLVTLPPSLLFSVCRQWRRLIYSPSFPPFLSLYALIANKKENQETDQSNSVCFYSLDPFTSKWSPLPTPPQEPPLHLLHRHPSFISRSFSIQSLAVSDQLVLIAATTHQFYPALPCPLVFNPLSNKWLFGPPLPHPRRWCVAGSVGGTVYVASGVGSHYQPDVARLAEKWDMINKKEKEWEWEKIEGMKNGWFSREAVEAIGYKGKLCMVNIKGTAVKEGAIYNIKENQWGKMAEGMLSGWNGPAGVSEEEILYVVDEGNGSLRKYDEENDKWEELIKGSEFLKGAEQIAVGGGRVCVVGGGGGGIAVVDVVVRPVRVYMVNPPPDMEVIAVHLLPRMSLPE